MIHQSAGREYLLEISGESREAEKVTYSGSSPSVLCRCVNKTKYFRLRQFGDVCCEDSLKIWYRMMKID